MEAGRVMRYLPFLAGLLTAAGIIYVAGVAPASFPRGTLHVLIDVNLVLALAGLSGRYLIPAERPPAKAWFFDALFFVLLLLGFWLPVTPAGPLAASEIFLYLISISSLVREFAALRHSLGTTVMHPARLFAISFLGLIAMGSFLLLLPNATHGELSLIDAVFTATSAVCVTGLIVVDTGTFFTPLGQWILIGLMQLGGIGIMTFTSYFSFFFQGAASFDHQLLLHELTNTRQISQVFKTLKQIILLTFAIEATGCVLIFLSLDPAAFADLWSRWFFSIFHAVSGFCNAGFSTLSAGLFDAGFRFNYPLLLILAGLFILGGIGFPILFNGGQYLRYVIKRLWFINERARRGAHIPWVVNINTRLVLITTALLVVAGTCLFYFFEREITLSDHSDTGKWVTAFFSATTPRTAGFNSIDFAQVSLPASLLVIFLMWVGASPASAGGGIKTSTLAIAALNVLSLAKGKTRIEIFRREVADISVRRSYAVIMLSLLINVIAIFLVATWDADQGILKIVFECFSAYSTVGLSMGITPALSAPSKVVLILCMFVGRISLLTVMIAFFHRVWRARYRYPTEEILIN